MVSDLVRATTLAIAAGAENHEAYSLIIDGEPVAKARARSGKYHHYTPEKQVIAERTIADRIKAGRPRRFDGNVAVAIIFYRSNNHRVDIDNLLKTVLDGITKSKVVWNDDEQVTALVGVSEYDPAYPRTVVAIAPHKSTLLRGTSRLTHTCETCGVKYKPHTQADGRASRYCSRSCRPRRVLICVDCGGPKSAPQATRCQACHYARRRKSA